MITSHHINMIRGNSLRDREVVAIDLKTRSRLFVVGGWPTLELITAAPRDRRRYSRSSVAVSQSQQKSCKRGANQGVVVAASEWSGRGTDGHLANMEN